MRINSISTRAMIILISVSILIVLVLGSLWLYTTKQFIENDLSSSDIQDSRHMVESVRMYLNDISSNANIVSTDPYTIASLQANDSVRLSQILNNLKASSPGPSAVILVDESGQVIYSTTPQHIDNISENGWYADMARSNGPYVTGLYQSSNLHDNAFAVLTPIKDNSTVIGRIVVVFTPESFQDSLKEHNLDTRDNIIVVDGSGNVISSNDLDKISLNTNLSSYSPVRQVISGKTGLMKHADSWDGQSRISAYQPVSVGNWGVIVSTPISVEYQPLYGLIERILGVLAIFIIFVSVLGFIASRYLTGPIVSLSGTMNMISGGDYHLRARTNRDDEIGELARTFNTMMDKLEDAKSQSEIYLDLMGHDINNMNQVALGYLQLADAMIESGEPVGKDNDKLIRKPIAALEDSSVLIDNIRKLQRAKTEEMRTGAVDICTVLSDLKDHYSQIPGRDIRIEISCTGKHIVSANDLIKDVFSNLIWNAIKHSEISQPLTVSLIVTEDEIDGRKCNRIAVEDNGPGITDDLKNRLFSRFSRGKTKAKGSGLGLYLVKSLVESYNGKVWVEDRIAGDHTKGCRFVVILPSA